MTTTGDDARAADGDAPRYLLRALAGAQRAFEARDRRAFGTINEYVQPVADAALAWIRDLEGEVARLTKEAVSVRIVAIDDERRRIIGAVEEAIGRGVCDGGKYRADIKSAINCALDDVRKERDEARREAAELRATLANERAVWVGMREDVLHGGCGDHGIEVNDILDKIDEYMPAACTEPAAKEPTHDR